MSSRRVVITGAGLAGCSAALEAVKRGFSVTLIDEHPQAPSMMSLDAPYFYGTRLPAILSDAGVVADRVLGANASLLDCLDAGVEVLTNTCVWANFLPGANLQYTDEKRLGLADDERSWLLPYDDLIIATGARDFVLSFPGWHLPGVLGAQAAGALLTRYQALGGTKAVVLGSGNVGLRLARQLLDSGVEVVAVVEVAATVRGDQALHAKLRSAGVAFRTSSVIDSAIGEREVRAVRLCSLDEQGNPIPSSEENIDCDTVCIAMGVVPNIELAAQSGCNVAYDPARGGWIPEIDDNGCTSLPNVYVIGEAAGVYEEGLLDPAHHVEQANRAAAAIGTNRTAAWKPIPSNQAAIAAPDASIEWLRALIAQAGLDVVLCQCEEVSRREYIAIEAPRYLQPSERRRAGPIDASHRESQDFVKRMTRCGMGHCQGKRCREHAALLLAQANGQPVGAIVPGSYRAPIRPLPLSVVAGPDESDEVSRTWPIWFQPLNEGEMG
jgi:D-hydroxyproline dehydrogenase subunit alpha